MNVISRIKRSSLASGAGTYILASMVNASIPLLLLPVLTRYLEPAEYGEVAVFHVWVALIGALCGLSVHGAATRKYYDYDEPDQKIGEFVSACVTLLVLSSAVFFILLLPFSGWISEAIGLTKSWLLTGVLFAFCNFLVQLRLGQWQVRKQSRRFGAFQIFMSLLNMLLSLLLVVVFALGVSGRLAGYTASVVLFGIAALLLLRRDGLLKLTWRPDLMKEALSFGVPLIPHIVGAFLLLTIDRAVISTQLGLDAAGYYMVAAQMAMVMGLMLDSINKAYVPWLYERLKRNEMDEKNFIVRLTYGYSVFLLLVAVLGFFIGGPILVFIAGENYQPAASVIGWLILAKSFHGMYYTVSSYIFFAKRTGVIAKITISTGLLNIFLLFMMTSHYGLIGAAWAMCISMLVQWLVTWRAASVLVHMPWVLRAK
ncbi:lipopolysaccharide biosynthesis protein [Marinobacter psychrophilus]|jgi:O-antigen/teichoic acid export membrane protein|uniref:lipopolysaccharide biosynthesis protein n=1 Tax=Marinobacter psychrophilus TaxID=330734 RepID=UPI001B4CA926|nr:oligosaccharide flippase family protein [Marinobacter psychrophilus]MBQ0764457.1 oligosaccharide flippase family protein [Marinobacter psychrophilus]MBQ0846308.1 oligosaccharide flippase family protein [Marinobacter psychrophilus]